MGEIEECGFVFLDFSLVIWGLRNIDCCSGLSEMVSECRECFTEGLHCGHYHRHGQSVETALRHFLLVRLRHVDALYRALRLQYLSQAYKT